MLEKIRQSRLLFWTLELVLLATLVFVLTKIGFLFSPVGTFFSTLFTPVLVGGFLFYILNPIVTVMEKYLKIKRIFGILIVFVLFLGILTFALINFIPSLIEQMSDLAKNLPTMAKQVQEWALGLEKYRVFRNLDIESYVKQLDFSWSDIAKNTLNGIANSLGSIFNFVAATTVIIGTVPFVLFYMLKDGEKLVPMLAKAVPVRQRANFIDLLGEMNKTIATYISGQAIECLFVFVMMFFGYLILGIKYAFLFAVIAGLCNLIPYIGPYLGLAPSFLATVFVDPFKALIIIVIVLVVQQIDGNLIYPNVIGKTLSIHPLAIIFVLLVAGNIAGLLGIFLGVPFYAICKTIIKFIWSLYCANKANLEQEKIEEETTQSEEI